MRIVPTIAALMIGASGALSLAGGAGGEEIRANPLAVVELFTSQGCASCPPADALLARLGTRTDIVALAYHVDYWDYAGWEDTFALPAHGELQKSYAASWGKTRVYTPQMVVNGARGVPGSQIEDVHGAVAQGGLTLDVTPRRDTQDVLNLEIDGDGQHAPAVVWLVTFRSKANVVIERGENSGQEFEYTHIVTGRQAIGMWDPEDGAQLRIPLSEAMGARSDGAAILVQEKRGELPGAILGAAAIHP